MTGWRSEARLCACGTYFKPKREAQQHCSRKCRIASAVAAHREKRLQPLQRQRRASQWASWPICPVCKLWRMHPRMGLPCHMFCIAVRKQKSEIILRRVA
jgi:hypothetical protein